MKDSNPPLSGQCQCGSIRYRVNGPPITFYACHCLDCQHQSSSAFGLSMWVAIDDFELVSGELKCWSTEGGDGTAKHCAFCADCGSRIYHAGEDELEPISLKAGALDNISEYRPVAHIWTKRAHAWLGLQDSGCLIYAGEPDDAELVEAWSQSQKRPAE